jgi:cation transport regulator ChaC
MFEGYRRTWTAGVPIYPDEEPGVVTGLFLDLTESHDCSCNGVVILISEAELILMDARERGYERRDVVVIFEDGTRRKGVTYVVPAQAKTDQGRVPRKYLGLLNTALESYPRSFREEFDSTTQSAPEPFIEGVYHFTAQQSVA